MAVTAARNNFRSVMCADKSMTALISGNADIALLGTEAGIYVYNEGKTNYAQPFAQLTQRAGNFLVSRTDDKNFKWTDVKGKEIIGGRVGGMPQMILEYVIKKNGLVIGKDVKMITNLQFESTAGAFAGGVGNFTAEFDPTAFGLEKAKQGYVVASLGLDSGKIPYTVYMAQKDYIKKNPQIIQSFTNAIYKGQLFVSKNSSKDIAAVVAPYFKEFDLESLEKMIDRYKKQDTWTAEPTFTEEGFTLIQDIMQDGGQLEKRVPFKEFVNNDFAKESIKNIKK